MMVFTLVIAKAEWNLGCCVASGVRVSAMVMEE
jgi:hypothetical protein